MKVYDNVLDLIGNTPLVRLHKIEKEFNLSSRLYAKIESFNLGGSIKDRVALKMIEDAFDKGLINEQSVIIEPTSGNTGIGLALVARIKGLRSIIVMPDTMSIERRNLLKAYGAELVLVEGSKGMKGAIEKAHELANEIPHSFIPLQFDNFSNPDAHYFSTAPEIYDALEGKVDIFVAGVGTGGTISGVGKYLKEKNPYVKIVAVEPLSSPVLSTGKSGAHKIQGIGAGFVPKVLNVDIYDEIIKVSNEDAYKYTKIVSNEGILVGISSGAALCAAIEVASRKENKDKNIVIIFPDSGERYLSVPDLFN